MKTTAKKEAFPSPLRLVIYLAVIAAFCVLNCLSLEAKIITGDPVTKGEYEIITTDLPVVQYPLNNQNAWKRLNTAAKY